jgi:hypothetical protein
MKITKNKFLLITITLFIGIILTTFTILMKAQYKPTKAITTAHNFFELMKNGKMEQAYSYTDKNNHVGKTLAQFNEKITKEWRNHGGNPHYTFKILRIFPFQSYGNVINRFITRRKINMDIISIDFLAQDIPFEIRLRSNKKGEWKVFYFQSHAM